MSKGQARTSDTSLFINNRSLMSPFFPAKRVNENDWYKIFPNAPFKDIQLAKGDNEAYKKRVKDALDKQAEKKT